MKDLVYKNKNAHKIIESKIKYRINCWVDRIKTALNQSFKNQILILKVCNIFICSEVNVR